VLLLQYVCPLGCLFNQISRFLFRHRLPRGTPTFASCRGLTSVRSFFVSWKGQTNCVSSSYTFFPPPPSLTKARWIFFPHVRSPSPTGFLFRGREGLNLPLLRYACCLGCLFRHPYLRFGAASVARRLLRSCRGHIAFV